MKKWILSYVIILLLMLTGSAVAQDDSPAPPPNPVMFIDPAFEVDEAAIEAATLPLIDAGAVVAIYLGGEGHTLDDMYDWLRQENLMIEDLPDDNLIAIMVICCEPTSRTSEILAGYNFEQEVIPRAAGIQQNILNLYLREGDYTAAFVNTLAAIEQGVTLGTADFNTEAGEFDGPTLPDNASVPIPTAPEAGDAEAGPLDAVASWMMCACLPALLVISFLFPGFSRLLGPTTYNRSRPMYRPQSSTPGTRGGDRFSGRGSGRSSPSGNRSGTFRGGGRSRSGW